MQLPDAMDQHEVFTVLKFVQAAAFAWGKSDLLAFGPDPQFSLVGELAAYLSMAADENNARRAVAVWVVMPPGRPVDEPAALDMLRVAFTKALNDMFGGKAPPAVVARAFDFINVKTAASFDGDDLLHVLKAAPAGTAIVVAEAHRFRLATLTPLASPQIEEDRWVAHAYRLAVEVSALCEAARSYVVLDFGAYAPSRQQNIDLLGSIPDTGFYCGLPANIDPDEIVARVSRWHDAAKRGEIGAVLREIAEDPGMSERQRAFMRLEAFSIARLHDKVREWLAENGGLLEDLPVDQSLQIARISEAADGDDYAEAILVAALPRIRSESEFTYALTTAISMRRRNVIDAVASSFSRLFPNAPMLRELASRDLVRDGDYSAAAQLVSVTKTGGRDIKRFYELMAAGTAIPEWAPSGLHDTILKELPQFKGEASREITRALDREGRRLECLMFLLSFGPDIDSTELLRLMTLTGLAMQAGEISSTDTIIQHVVDSAVAYLSTHPQDGHVRVGLSSLMAPNITANAGQAILILAVLRRAETLPNMRERPPVDDRPAALDADVAQPHLNRIWDYLQAQGNGVWLIEHQVLPASELEVPADALISLILLCVEYVGDRLADAQDFDLVMRYVAAAHAVAPLSPERDEDLTVIRTAASKLILAGRGQAARDLAEFAITIAGDRPERHRQALFTFADIYARLGMKTEALVALAAMLETSGEATWDQIWFESNLLFRMLRDAGMSKFGLPVLKRSKKALEMLGLADRDGYRLDTMALQANVAQFDKEHGDDRDVVALIGAAQENAETVLARRDDVVPIAMVLNALIAIAADREILLAEATDEIMERLIAAAPGPQQQKIRAAGPSPSLADIAEIAAAIDEARYADDVGYDLRHLRLMTRRLVGQAIDTVEPATMIYAVEASADRAISLKTADGTRVDVDRLLARTDGPLAVANEMSKLGAAVVGLAIFNNQLATVEFENGVPSDLTVEPEQTFSVSALSNWSKRFPWDYRLEDKCLSREEVRGSVVGLGLTKLPKRSVLIADARLQRLPPNLLSISGNFAGFEHAIAIAPSLEWLSASRKLDRRGTGAARIWIPVPATSDDKATLKLMADELGPTLDDFDVPLERGTRATAEFANADVAIIGAHGGLAELNRYFRSVSNDDHDVTEISEVTEMTRRARVTILFVCSGGRIDPHPETGMAIGLAKQIVARGSAAVIAPAWPIPFFVAKPWLKGFLAAWRSGDILLDAYHKANLEVAKSSSWDPKRTLAMTLYGDPFVRGEYKSAP